MLIETTQIVFGPGRFLAVGTVAEFPPAEALDLINAGKARQVETAMKAAPENAMKPTHNHPRQRPQRS